MNRRSSASLLFETGVPRLALEYDRGLSRVDIPVDFCSVLAAYAIERLRFQGSRYVGMSISAISFRRRPFIPLAAMVYKLDLLTPGWR
jgi:multiple sugar transport system permease protein